SRPHLAAGGEVHRLEELVELGVAQADAEVSRLDAEGFLHGEERIVVDLLGDQPYNLTRLVIVPRDVPSQDRRRARGGNHEPRDASDERALPRSVRPQKAEDLPLADFERDLVEGEEKIGRAS